MKSRLSTFFVLICFLVGQLAAQQDVLPKGFAPGEKALMPTYIKEALRSNRQQIALPENPRSMAEWEELQGIVIAWTNSFRAIQAEIVRHASKEAVVYIVNQNESQVKSFLNQAGVDYSENVVFIDGDYNSIWIRDYGPNSVYINDVDSLVFIDWIYNRPRPLDDQIPQIVGSTLQVETIELNQAPNDLVHTGGNFMSDGLGLGFSSNLVQDENGPFNNYGSSNHSKEAIDSLMYDYMGIHTYVNMENLPYDLIHHIDMHMKLVDEETLIVGQYPNGIADGPQIEANLQYVIENFRTSFGRPFDVVRIPMPPDDRGRYPHQNGDYRTYANAMMVNGAVLLPIYEERYDTTAIRIWEETLPGHDIVGIDCNAIIPLSGALHCIIKEIGVKNPIWIQHQPLKTVTEGVEEELELTVEVRHRDSLDQVDVFYSLDGGATYDSLKLIFAGANQWKGQFSLLPVGEVIYFVRATAQNGKVIDKPLTAEEGGGWRFDVLPLSSVEDIQPTIQLGEVFPNPASSITAIPLNVTNSRKIKAELVDMNGVVQAVLHDGVYDHYRQHLFFNAANFSSGLYVVSIQTSDGSYTTKIVIQ